MSTRAFNRRRLAVGLFLGVFAFLGLTSSPATAAPVKSEVVINKVQTRLYGYVRSDSPRSCSKNRQVVVLKTVKGKPAKRVGQSKTRKFGTKAWQWSLPKKSGNGTYRAELPAKPGCAKDKSGPITIGLKGDVYPGCDYRQAYSCWIGRAAPERLYFLAPGYCPSIGKPVGDCSGQSFKGSDIWGSNQSASLRWSRQPGESYVVEYEVSGASFVGRLPDPGSANLTIVDGRLDDHKQRFCTPDLPGVDAGKAGGPINLDFENDAIGAEVYFYGVIRATESRTEC